MARRVRIGLSVAICLVIPLLPWITFALIGETPSGLRVDGQLLAPTERPRPVLETRARAWLGTEMRITVDDVIRRPRRRELGARIDVPALSRRAHDIGRTGLFWRDVPALFRAWSGSTDLAWPLRIDGRVVRAFVVEIAQQADRPPRGPVIDARGRVLELSADGLRVRRTDAVRVLMNALRDGRRGIALPTERLSSGVGERALPPVLHPNAHPMVIGRYSTEYRRVERARAHNIETAAGFLDGAVIAPYGRLSFNDRVGARDRSHGYREAHVILDGEMVDGIGGGVCQVASTLHAAAFLSGLEIAQHTPHSRPSQYIPMGLDATVVWPTVDLVIANPFAFPITVRAFARHGQMTVELFGTRRARRVDWRHNVLSSTPFGDRYVEDQLVAPGQERVSQDGRRGVLVLRQRTIVDERGLRLEENHIRYPPTDRIVRVPPGTLDPVTGLPAATEPVATLPDNPF